MVNQTDRPMTEKVSAERRRVTGKYYQLSSQIRPGDTRRGEGGVRRRTQKFRTGSELTGS